MALTLSQKKQMIKNRKHTQYNYDVWARHKICLDCGEKMLFNISGFCKKCIKRDRLMYWKGDLEREKRAKFKKEDSFNKKRIVKKEEVCYTDKVKYRKGGKYD